MDLLNPYNHATRSLEDVPMLRNYSTSVGATRRSSKCTAPPAAEPPSINTNVFCLFYRYVDFTSLYPWCNKNTRNVVGHPQIITENFADISTYFGLIKCTILPPRGLLHPVLPYRTPENLMFPLCKTCADTKNQNPCTHTDQERAICGTWCHVEVMKAIEKGYVVLNIHEVWHWEETTDELFKEYVNTFLKIKQEASGYPPDCVTDEQKQRYIDDYYEHEGIRLDPEKIEYNPGLRYLAKLILNSLWGKWTLVSSVGRVRSSSYRRAPFRVPVQVRNLTFLFFS